MQDSMGWWAALAVVPGLGALAHARPARAAEDASDKWLSRRDDGKKDGTEADTWVCERVCTTKKLLSAVGSFAKDPIAGTCVTVCGVSSRDACEEACEKVVCLNPHHVPEWNEVCLKRCTNECLRLHKS